MKDLFNGVSTAYRVNGDGQDVILLHGWGQNMFMMHEIEDHLKGSFRVWNLDFPGFGESDEPSTPWGVPDYRDFLADFIEKNHINNPILIGHSFGCRVAIRYAAMYQENVKKMVLTGAAGIKPKQTFEQKTRTNIYKAGKWLLKTTGQTKKLEELQNKSGSEDYRNAKGIMRPTFVKVVNDDVSDILKDVICPVLLVWGENDTAAPLWMGKQMEKEMKDAGLAIFASDDHFAYWNQSARFNAVLDVFLDGDKK